MPACKLSIEYIQLKHLGVVFKVAHSDEVVLDELRVNARDTDRDRRRT